MHTYTNRNIIMSSKDPQTHIINRTSIINVKQAIYFTLVNQENKRQSRLNVQVNIISKMESISSIKAHSQDHRHHRHHQGQGLPCHQTKTHPPPVYRPLFVKILHLSHS